MCQYRKQQSQKNQQPETYMNLNYDHGVDTTYIVNKF